MSAYQKVVHSLEETPRRWLVTGAAGFIGSHLLQRLLELGQHVVALDNFATGRPENLDDACSHAARGSHFEFIEGDICDFSACQRAVQNVEFVLHEAALGSVPRSIDDPIASHAANVNGFINLLTCARDSKVTRFVYASSSSVYGDDTSAVKTEAITGSALSPYAATKQIDEIYAGVFGKVFEIECLGLRYFNVFGARQDPNGPYAAVIPRWARHLLAGEPCSLFGEGAKSRDFCYVANVVQANLLAALAPAAALEERVYNVACGARTTLEELFELIRARVAQHESRARSATLRREAAKVGDIPHSLADIARAQQLLGYEPTHDIEHGLDETVRWYATQARAGARSADKAASPGASLPTAAVL